jgi:hypothetical protein
MGLLNPMHKSARRFPLFNQQVIALQYLAYNLNELIGIEILQAVEMPAGFFG